jgi:hypothetical protein
MVSNLHVTDLTTRIIKLMWCCRKEGEVTKYHLLQEEEVALNFLQGPCIIKTCWQTAV